MPSTLQSLFNHNLFVTTPNALYLHSPPNRKVLFECATPDGILNSRAAKDNSGLLAIADSQLVLLHDSARGKAREYKLKSGDGEPRLLLFSPDSRVLYFTTTLSPSIQAYSISTAELLAPPQIHPSPPNVLSISKDGNVLLSASSAPPTIFIQDLRIAGSAPAHFHPHDARSPATCSAFNAYDNPSEIVYSIVFLVGFQDGMLAVYELSRSALLRSRPSSYIDQTPGFSLQPTKLGAVRKLHKAAMGGIVAAEFLPGFRSRVVSVGRDGRCRLIDFNEGPNVLRTWDVSGPATCLSVLLAGQGNSKDRQGKETKLDGDITYGSPMHESLDMLIAIGTQVGKVLVFNLLGLLVQEMTIEAPVLAIEWVGDMTAPSILPNRVVSRALSSRSPLLDTVFPDFDSESDSGTVKKTVPPIRQSSTCSPVPLDRAPDLFTFAPPERRMSSWTRNNSIVSTGSPSIVDRTQSRHPPLRKSYPRPRIVTETFKDPAPGPLHTFQPSLHGQSNAVVSSTKLAISAALDESCRWPRAYSPSTTLIPPVVGYSPSEYSQASELGACGSGSDAEKDTFFTPPTSRRVRSPFRTAMKRKSGGMKAKESPFGMKSVMSDGGIWERSPSQGKERHVSFPSRSSPKTGDGEMESSSRRIVRCSSEESVQSSKFGPDIGAMKMAARKRSVEAEKIHETGPVRQHKETGSGDADGAVAALYSPREETEGLRQEMQDLKREFRMLREAFLSRT